MSTSVKHEPVPFAPNPITTEAAMGEQFTPGDWEALCAWLTQTVRDMEATVERREGQSGWVVESLFHPVGGFTTRVTVNGVRLMAVDILINGHHRIFEIAAPNTVRLERNAAGLPTKLEIGYQEGVLALQFCGPLLTPPGSTSNAWGE